MNNQIVMKKDFKIIGKPTPKHDAKMRVTGQSVYGHDIQLPGMLHAAILRTKYPSAVIKSIDTSLAEKLPGVECVITADDIDVNPIGYKRDHPVMKAGEVNCIRDEIAAVAAQSKAIAKEAIRLIKVEYEERKGIFDPFEALEDHVPQLNKFKKQQFENKNIAETFHYAHGDLEAEKKASSCIVKRRYHLPRVTHCCLGTSNITADWSATEEHLTLHSSTQVPFLYQRDMAHCLKMEPSKIRVIQPIIGGGFGSKLDMHPFEPICALLSMKTNRPVQLIYDRQEEFIASPTRQPMVIDLETGCDAEGNFTFREIKIVKDNGAYTSWGATTPFVIMQAFSSLYQVKACLFDAIAVYTNNPFAGSFRGYGNPQATFALERNIDLMAEELGIDKALIRQKNANYKGEVTGQGLHYVTCGHKEALDYVINNSNYHQRKEVAKNGRFRRGIGFGSMLHVGGGAKIYRSDGCGTTVKMDDYGYLTIITGSNEIGQGSETVLAMIAAEELGIDMDRIKVINSDTDIKPWDVGVHASRTSFVAGNSLLGALAILKNKLSAKAADMLKVSVASVKFEAGNIISTETKDTFKIDKVVREMHFDSPHELAVASYFYEPGSKFQDKEFKGNVSGTYAFAAQAIEVEVDTYTGNVKVLDVWVSQDVGKVLNPLGLAGQVEGGVVMGMGYAITEELKLENGVIVNPNFHEYKLPTASDIPNIHFYPVETIDSEGPYGAKGVGEAPLIPTAAAIANAVSNALDIEIDTLPLSPERILRLLDAKQKTKQEKTIKSAVS